jgi:hypothetical protein
MSGYSCSVHWPGDCASNLSCRVHCPYSCVTTFLEYSDIKQLYGADVYKIYTCALKYKKVTSTFSSRSVLYRNDLMLMPSGEFWDQEYCLLGWSTVPSAGKFGHLLKFTSEGSSFNTFSPSGIYTLKSPMPDHFKSTANNLKCVVFPLIIIRTFYTL